MSYNTEGDSKNLTGKYLQVQCLDAECDGTGSIADYSFLIKKLTDDTLELIEWRTRDATARYHAKPITEQ